MIVTSIRNILPVVVLLMGIAGPHAANAQDNKDAVLARFANGEVITAKEFSEYVNRRIDLRPATRNASGVTAVVKEMALTRALNLEGPGAGVPRRNEDRFDDIHAHAVFAKLTPVCAAPKDEAEAKDFYEKNPKAFTAPASVRLSRVILPADTQVDGKNAADWLYAQAEAVARGRPFDEVASQAEKLYKLDAQGDLGWASLNEENVILRALGDAGAGDLVGPVKDGDFVYLFQVVTKRPSQKLSWADVSTVAAKRAVSYCREEAHSKIQDQLLEKYGVQVDDASVRGLFDIKQP